MNRGLAIAGALLAVVLIYLLAWPVPIDPVSWDAPVDRGLVDPFTQNDLLSTATGVDLGDFEGPEDATVGVDGRIYATTSGGQILRIDNGRVSNFAFAGGRPLGIETDRDGSVVVANAHVGLQRIDQRGKVTTVLHEFNGGPLYDANSLAIAADGTIYFSVSSRKFGAEKFHGSYEASLLDIMEHGGQGLLLAFDPSSGETAVVLENLNYANGVALSPDDSYVLVSETGHYRVLKHWLAGTRRGTTDVLIENLPGFPDNLKNGLDGRFWLGFAAPRNKLLDQLSDKPLLRKIVQRLPAFLRPKAVPASHVIAFDGEGRILMNMHDPAARFPTLTGVVETDRALYLTTLFGHELPKLDKGDL